MKSRSPTIVLCLTSWLLLNHLSLSAQQPPYDLMPAAEPPYYRVRYEAGKQPGELMFAVNYTLWVPPGTETLRGLIVHQHGCGEGSCKSGLTGAYDLHWQALAKRHACALLAPAYEQPEKADCQMWCDPRNGSSSAFLKGLQDLGAQSGHPELTRVPWALWGHSGGGHWAGGMVMLYPERVAAAWLRSGVPLLTADDNRNTIKPHALPEAALSVPLMCNLGTQEGVSVQDGRFAGVWPANQTFFHQLRGKGGLIGVAIDPLSAHECANQRYLAIPWLDACLSARLPQDSTQPLRAMPLADAWLGPITGGPAVAAADFSGDRAELGWLPNEAIARAWMQYVHDSAVADTTPPPAPTALQLKGIQLSWQAEADLESGLAGFRIERDGQLLAELPEKSQNPYGRPIFQNLQYSDTPTQPLVTMQFSDTSSEPGRTYDYRVVAINTVGLLSEPSPPAVRLATTTSVDQPAPASDAGQSIKIFILAGQSNMQGHGFVTADDKRNQGQGSLEYLVKKSSSQSRFEHLLGRDGEWAKRDDVWITYLERQGPLSVGYGVQPDRIGPELGFGWVVGDSFDSPVLIIKCAWGGKSLAVDFRPPSSGAIPYSLGEAQDAAIAADPTIVGKYYRDTLNLTKASLGKLAHLVPDSAGRRVELAGFGWHQGWNDRISDQFNAEYQENMANFIRDMRRDLETPQLPFVIAETGMNGPQESHPRALSLMAAQAAVAELPEFKGNVAFVGTQAFWRPADQSPSGQGYHWNTNAETYYLIGEAMGRAMCQLLQQPARPANEQPAINH